MFEARVREVSARRERPMGVVSRNPNLLREEQELIGEKSYLGRGR